MGLELCLGWLGLKKGWLKLGLDPKLGLRLGVGLDLRLGLRLGVGLDLRLGLRLTRAKARGKLSLRLGLGQIIG